MAVDFSAFDEAVDTKALATEVANTEVSDNSPVPKGKYIVGCEKLELTLTKKDNQPLVSAWFKIKEGSQKGRLIFFNRKIKGNKVTEKWNDAKAIKTVTTWLEELGTDVEVTFESYSQFAELLADIKDATANLEFEVEFDEDAFNPIKVTDVFDI